LLEEVLILF